MRIGVRENLNPGRRRPRGKWQISKSSEVVFELEGRVADVEVEGGKWGGEMGEKREIMGGKGDKTGGGKRKKGRGLC